MGGIEAALIDGAEHAGEHLLTVSAASRAITAATHFARHDGGPQRVFGAPVGRVERGVKEKAEDGVEFDDEVLLKASHTKMTTGRALEQAAQPLNVLAARHREALRRHVATAMRVTRRQRGLQDGLHRGDQGLSRIVEEQHATSPQEVRETRLMGSLFELPIRLPTVADQDARIVLADDGRGLREPAAGLNRIDRRVGRDKRPEPLQVGVDAPTGFIGGDHRTPAHGGGQVIVGRLRAPRRPVHRLDQAAAGDAQPEAIAQQRGDLAVREAAAFIEQHGEGDELGAELRGRGAERVRRLQRMSPLHAAAASGALADVDVKRPDDRALHRQLFLILRGDAPSADRAGTVWTAGRQRRLVPLIDAGRWPPMRARAIGGPRLTARTSRRVNARAAGKGGRLTRGGATRRVQLLVEFLDLPTQPLPLRFGSSQVLVRPPQVLAELLVFAAEPLDLGRVGRRHIRLAAGHAPVMPDPRAQYKRKDGPASADPLT